MVLNNYLVAAFKKKKVDLLIVATARRRFEITAWRITTAREGEGHLGSGLPNRRRA